MKKPGFRLSRMSLRFDDPGAERAYLENFEIQSRQFIRVGIIMSTAGWLAVAIYAYVYHRECARSTLLLIATSLMPLFTFLFFSTYSARFIRWYQPLSALANLAAGLMTTYLALFLMRDSALATTFLIAVIFFAFFILRIRFALALACTIVYLIVYQTAIILLPEMSGPERLISLGVWITEISCGIGGYTLESAWRRIFLQNRTIESQRISIAAERERSERLLLNVLPSPIAERLKNGEKTIAERFDDASVLFADIVEFTPLCSGLEAEEVVDLLNEVFSLFDEIAVRYELEKIKTVGDAYMVVAGVPEPTTDHVSRLVAFGRDVLCALDEWNRNNDRAVRIRIGINSGPLVAGVIGTRKFLFDVWGDTVNVASRMESIAPPGSILISEATFRRLRGEIRCIEREQVEVKGKGLMRSWIVSRDQE